RSREDVEGMSVMFMLEKKTKNKIKRNEKLKAYCPHSKNARQPKGKINLKQRLVSNTDRQTPRLITKVEDKHKNASFRRERAKTSQRLPASVPKITRQTKGENQLQTTVRL